VAGPALQRVDVEEPRPAVAVAPAKPLYRMRSMWSAYLLLPVASSSRQPSGSWRWPRRSRCRPGPRELEAVAKLSPRAAIRSRGEVRLRSDHVGPAVDRGLQQGHVAALGCHVRDTRFEIQRATTCPTSVPASRTVLVLQIAQAETGITDQPVPALLDPLAGQFQIWPVPSLPVQLHQRRLHDRMAVQPASAPRNVLTRWSANRRATPSSRLNPAPRCRRWRPGSGGRRSTSHGCWPDRCTGMASDLDVGVQYPSSCWAFSSSAVVSSAKPASS